jgi:hypothetical protein
MKRPSIGGKDFFKSHGTRRINRRRSLENLGEKEFLVTSSCVIFLENFVG